MTYNPNSKRDTQKTSSAHTMLNSLANTCVLISEPFKTERSKHARRIHIKLLRTNNHNYIAAKMLFIKNTYLCMSGKFPCPNKGKFWNPSCFSSPDVLLSWNSSYLYFQYGKNTPTSNELTGFRKSSLKVPIVTENFAPVSAQFSLRPNYS